MLLGLKLSANLGGTSMRCFVPGFTTTRYIFFFTSKLPKPWMLSVRPSSSFSAKWVVNACVSCCVSLVLMPMRAARAVINSLLFTLNIF